MKKLIAFLLIVSCAVALFGCTNNPSTQTTQSTQPTKPTQSTPPAAIPPERPEDTNLEFWIGEDVENVDFSEHDERYGGFGVRQFLGKEYRMLIDENGDQQYPDVYVSYSITAFPDYADGGNYVTDITIKDPDVQLYGLTIHSTEAEFKAVFEEMGYAVYTRVVGISTDLVAEKDGVRFCFSHGESIRIKAEVTNRHGIMY